MLTLVIINSIINLAVVVYFIWKYSPISITFERTFWMKRITGIIFWWRTSECSKTSILTLRFRSYNVADDWDQKQFKNGNYSKGVK